MKMGSGPEVVDADEHVTQLIPWLINGTLGAEDAASVRAHLAVCPSCRADLESEQKLYDAVQGDSLLVFSGEPSFQKLMARIEADDFAAMEAAPVAAGPSPFSGDGPVPHASVPRPPHGGASQASTLDRAHTSNRATSRSRNARRRLWRTEVAVRWLAAAVVIEAVGLGLGAWAWQAHTPPRAPAYAMTTSASRSDAALYRTLTTPAPAYGAGPGVRIVFRPRLSLDQLQKLLRGVGAHIVDGPTEAHVYTLGFAEHFASSDELDERIAMLRADPNVLFAEPAEVRPP